MATQEHITLSNPSFAQETQGFAFVSKKEKDKQQKELAHLAVLLKELEQEVARAKVGAEGGDKVVDIHSGQPQGPSESPFEEGMAEMALALQLLQVEIAKFSRNKSRNDAEVANALAVAAKNTLHSVEAAQKKFAKLQQRNKDLHIAIMAITCVVAGVVAIASCLAGQPEIAVAVVAMAVAGATGILQKATDALAMHVFVPLFEKLGTKPAAAKEAGEIMAAVVIIAAVCIATMGVGGAEAGAVEGAEVGADVAASGAEGAGQAAEEAGEEAAESTASSTTRLTSLRKGVFTVLRRLRANPGIRAALGIQAASDTGLVKHSVEILLDPVLKELGVKKSDRKEIEDVTAEILAIIATLVATIAGGAASSTLAEDTGASLARLRIAKWGGLSGMILGSLAQGGATGLEAYTMGQTGNVEAIIAALQGQVGEIHGTLRLSSDQTKADQRFASDTFKSQNTSNQALADLMKGEEGFANLFTANSPV